MSAIEHAPAGPVAPPVLALLANFVRECRGDFIPPEVLHEGKRLLLHGLKVTIAGAHREDQRRMLDWISTADRGGPARLLWLGDAVSVEHAIVFNTLSWFGADVTHQASESHPMPSAGSAALAEGQRRAASGRRVLEAIILAVEAQLFVATSLGQSVFARGFTIPGLTSPLGSAAASAVVADLSLASTQAALGSAMVSAVPGIVREHVGSGAVKLMLGAAAWIGAAAAALADRGLECPATVFDGELGQLRMYSDNPVEQARAQAATLGSVWQILELSYTPFQGGHYAQTPLEALLEIRSRVSANRARAVAGIRCAIPAKFLPYQEAKRRFERPLSEFQASADLAFALAHAWHAGRSPLHALSAAERDADATYRLRDGVEFVGLDVDDSDWLTRTRSEVTVSFEDGTVESAAVDIYRGHPSRPLTDGDLEDMFRHAAEGLLSERRTEEIIAAVWALDERCEDINDFVALLVTGRASAGV